MVAHQRRKEVIRAFSVTQRVASPAKIGSILKALSLKRFCGLQVQVMAVQPREVRIALAHIRDTLTA